LQNILRFLWTYNWQRTYQESGESNRLSHACTLAGHPMLRQQVNKLGRILWETLVPLASRIGLQEKQKLLQVPSVAKPTKRQHAPQLGRKNSILYRVGRWTTCQVFFYHIWCLVASACLFQTFFNFDSTAWNILIKSRFLIFLMSLLAT